MIPVVLQPTQPPDSTWQAQLRDSFRDAPALLRFLGLEGSSLATQVDLQPAFPLRVPKPFAARMAHGDAKDPLLLQVLALNQEHQQVPGFFSSPLREDDFRSPAGLMQKYRHRALVIAAGSCAVNCRYCFRRHFPYQEHQAEAGTKAWLAQVRADTSLHELILSGGDPLMLRDSALAGLLAELDGITHIQRVRIHTRLPVVIPDRITRAFVKLFAGRRFVSCVVLHINHPHEIDQPLREKLNELRPAVTLLNQSVLLKDINNDVETLAQLSEELFAAGVLPYYLHQLDRVAGAAHFAIDDASALELIKALRARLPGYLVPRLVREIPGQPSKTQLS